MLLLGASSLLFERGILTPAAGGSSVSNNPFARKQAAQPVAPTSREGFGPAALPTAAPFGGASVPAPPIEASSQGKPERDAVVESISDEDRVWAAPVFERGKIPDEPPPAKFCIDYELLVQKWGQLSAS